MKIDGQKLPVPCSLVGLKVYRTKAFFAKLRNLYFCQSWDYPFARRVCTQDNSPSTSAKNNFGPLYNNLLWRDCVVKHLQILPEFYLNAEHMDQASCSFNCPYRCRRSYIYFNLVKGWYMCDQLKNLSPLALHSGRVVSWTL